MVNGRIAALDTDSETCKVKGSRMEKVTLIDSPANRHSRTEQKVGNISRYSNRQAVNWSHKLADAKQPISLPWHYIDSQSFNEFSPSLLRRCPALRGFFPESR